MIKLIMFSTIFGISSAVFAGEMIIGVQVPITGKFASEGQGIDNAVRLLVSQVNLNGGINGDKFKVISCDDEASPQKAVVCAKTLINAGAKVVIGSYTSTATEASQGIYAKAGVIQTSDSTAANLLSHGYPAYFRSSFNDNIEGQFTANYFVNVKKYKRIAILNDYSAFSAGLGGAVSGDIKSLGGNIVYNGKINAGDQDFHAVLTDIKSKSPDVIYYSGYYTEGALLRFQQAELGIKADFVGGNSNDNPDFLKIAGKAAVGSYLVGLPLPEQLDTELVKTFAKDYKTTYKIDIPSIWTITSSDGLLTIFTAMQAIKSNDPHLVAKYIHGSIKNVPCYTGTITITTSGERDGNIYQISQIQPNMKYAIVYHH